MTRLLLVAAAALTLGACSTLPEPPAPAGPPPPPPPPPLTDVSDVVYTCADGTRFTIYFSENAATVTLSDGTKLNLPQQPSASGILYSSGRHEFRGKGRDATWTVGRMTPTQCQTK